ncbi:putative TRAP transporter solute receptor, TAXI family [Blastococcus saxobsidens DD2]|uniref:Putative TRAP transporter solute receptor, TAXI family n=2 Tax=Blastococcus saxobsidens TaxID=138336 RepID=H6RT03_BLASD|nr:putative TRAP transporter solute receptor, TAXI family [Blastococcus saxobsidens DD2]
MRTLKPLAIRSTALVIAAGVMTACGAEGGDVDAGADGGGGNGDSEAAYPDVDLSGTFLTGSSGGVYDALGGGMAGVISEEVPGIRLNPSNPPNISVVIQRITDGAAVLGIMQADAVYRAIEGVGEFDQPYDQVRFVMGLYDNVMSQVVLEDSPLNTCSDVAGQSVGVPSETTQQLVAAVYETCGVSESEIEWVYLTYAEQAAALRDGDIDVGTFTGYPKNATVEELAATAGIKFIETPDEVVDTWNEENPLTAFATIPAGTYPGVDTDERFYAIFANLITSSEVPEDAIYAITKAVTERADDIGQIHPAGESIGLEKIQQYLDDGILDPDYIHAGALRYFEEEGLTIPGA